jgi:hypothetical protein
MRKRRMPAVNDGTPGDAPLRPRRRNPYSASGRDYFKEEFSNVSTDSITITHDKLENILIKSYQRHLSRSAWINPLSILLALGLSVATSDFKSSAFGIDASTWRAFFMIVLIGSCIWLAWSVIQLVKSWKGSSIEALINRIKNVDS